MKVSEAFSWRKRLAKRENNPLLPHSIRGLIIGKSNCGKTTLLLNLLLRPGWLDYDQLYVFGKTLHQQEYQIMKKGFEVGLSKKQISNIFKNQDEFQKIDIPAVEVIAAYSGEKKGTIKAQFISDCSMIPDPAELNPNRKNLLILDDCFLGPQSKAEAYYTRGRQNNCDTFYISQSYFRLPRHTVRENANLIILFPQDAKNLQHIYADHCEGDMSLEQFKRFCRTVWDEDEHGFIALDLSGEKKKKKKKSERKYLRNLASFYSPIDGKFYPLSSSSESREEKEKEKEEEEEEEEEEERIK